MDVLAERRRPLVTLSNLSEMYAPYLTGHSTRLYEGLTIVVGDTPADRLAFWNGIHRKDRSRPYEIQQLRLSRDSFEDAAFLASLRRVMATRGAYGSANRNDAIGLESCSLNREQLVDLGNRLREAGNFLTVSVRPLGDPSEVIPVFDGRSSARYSTGGFMEEPEAKASTEFRGRHLSVPVAPPWHVSEAMPPQPMRGGAWMVDVMLEREVDHSRSSNVRDVWMLPRRIRIERAFTLEMDSNDRIGNPPGMVRPNVNGMYTFATNLTQRAPMLALPEDDLTAIGIGIQDGFEWREFERQRKPPKHGRERFQHSAISDKGRYLLGVLQLFEDVPHAFATLMEGFWHDEFQVLGAGLLERRPDLATRVVSTIRNRLGQKTGPVTLRTETEFARLGEVALRAAAELRAETPARSYGELAADWKQSVEEWLKRDGTPQIQGRMAVVEVPSDDPDGERGELSYPADYLDPAIQYLCERQVLFQGYHWTCQTCFNKNWSGVEGLGRSMECSVCRTARPVPVSDEWDFRANGFLVDAYRFHGVEAVIWAMWTLFRQARSSFYFSPSLTLWKAYPQEGRPKKPDAEVDAIVIADGLVYAIEATRSKGLSADEIEKLTMIAERIRPNVLYVAAGEQSADDLKALQGNLQKQMPTGVEAQVVAFDPKALSRAPYLWGAR
ncbi:hypothetical protein [Devosia sp. Root105]|uniref:hypothetical protein n=1 Tax=Devosia sp. Root105 TaxID=1736423 RepID=UPI000B1E3503|nr:hypothetical protein [Devosia sp. Root105]